MTQIDADKRITINLRRIEEPHCKPFLIRAHLRHLWTEPFPASMPRLRRIAIRFAFEGIIAIRIPTTKPDIRRAC
jgi:hypothetical protein